MYKIATHDSATGESSKGIFSLLLTPFAKTQSKTIAEQYNFGCRSFDIRVKLIKDNWYCAHGPWRTKRTAWDIIEEINSFEDRCQVCIVYEGKLDDKLKALFISLVERLKQQFIHIIWGYAAGKYAPDTKGVDVKYEIIIPSDKGYEGGVQGFLPLDGSTWHTYLPIPWLWDKLYTRPHIFREDVFTYVDFL